MKSQTERHRIHQLDSTANSAKFDLIHAKQAALPKQLADSMPLNLGLHEKYISLSIYCHFRRIKTIILRCFNKLHLKNKTEYAVQSYAAGNKVLSVLKQQNQATTLSNAEQWVKGHKNQESDIGFQGCACSQEPKLIL